MSNRTILIVEDEPIIGADLQDRLSDLGFHVLGCVSSGEEALTFVLQKAPDLVLMDIQLAGALDGVDTAIRLREIADFQLVFLTSNSDDKTFERARYARPQAFLSKPFRGRDLIHAIELALGGSQDTGANTAGREPSLGGGEAVEVSTDRLFIKEKDRLVRLMLTDILYLEADDYYCKVHTKDKVYLATKTLKKLSDQLPPQAPFFRCHRSYVVNLERITEISEVSVFLDQRKIPLSRSKRSEVLTLVNKM